MPLQLRAAEEKDVPAILEIVNDAILNSTAIYDYEARSLEFQRGWFNKKEADNMPVVVAELNGNVVGFGSYGIFRPWAGYRFSVEHSIYVAESVRGQGIGKLILAELIRLAKAQQYHVMIAGIDAANKASISFHKKFGFEEVGRFNEVGYKFDRWLDLVFMQLFL